MDRRHLAHAISISQEIASVLDRFKKEANRWHLVSPSSHDDHWQTLSRLRAELSATIEIAPDETVGQLACRPDGPLTDAWSLCTDLAGRPTTEQERIRQEKALDIDVSEPGSPSALRCLMILALYNQPFDLPDIPDLADLPEDLLRPWLRYLLAAPAFIRPEDERKFIAHQDRMLDRLIAMSDMVNGAGVREHYRRQFFETVREYFNYGATFVVDLPVERVVRKRGKLLEAVRAWAGGAETPAWHQAARPPGRKLRVGILTRNMLNYTDSWAVYSHFQAFDRERYDIYFYSLEVSDLHVPHNLAFYRQLWNLPVKVVALRGNLADDVRLIREDDLDFFVLASAYVGPTLIVSHRLARLQVVLNSFVPSSTGLRSFDVLITSRVGADYLPNLTAEATEEIWMHDAPLVWFERRPPAPPLPHVNRAALGIPDDAVLYYNSHAVQKNTPPTLRCWLTILDRVPNSVLLLTPYSPGWDGPHLACMFETRLRDALADFPRVSRDRIVMTGKLKPDESECLMALSDVFLGSFPHGGATSVMLSLLHGVPCVARESLWLRGTSDASMVARSGLPELIGRDNDAYVDIAVRLGNDRAYREAIRRKVGELGPASPVFDTDAGSRQLQAVFDRLAEEKLGDRKQHAPMIV